MVMLGKIQRTESTHGRSGEIKARVKVHLEEKSRIEECSFAARLPFLPYDVVTVALTAGVPLEIVQKLTGHRTTAIVPPLSTTIISQHVSGSNCRRGPPTGSSSSTPSNWAGRNFAGHWPGKLRALPGDRSKPAAEALNVADLRATLTSMERTTWRLICDELRTRLPKEVNVMPTQPVLLKNAFAA